VDIRKIKKLIELLEESSLTEIEIVEGEESVHKFSRLAWEDGMTEKEYEKYVISEDIDLYIRYGGIYVDFSGYSYDELLPLEFNDSLPLALKKKYIRGYPTWIKELRDSL